MTPSAPTRHSPRSANDDATRTAPPSSNKARPCIAVHPSGGSRKPSRCDATAWTTRTSDAVWTIAVIPRKTRYPPSSRITERIGVARTSSARCSQRTARSIGERRRSLLRMPMTQAPTRHAAVPAGASANMPLPPRVHRATDGALAAISCCRDRGVFTFGVFRASTSARSCTRSRTTRVVFRTISSLGSANPSARSAQISPMVSRTVEALPEQKRAGVERVEPLRSRVEEHRLVLDGHERDPGRMDGHEVFVDRDFAEGEVDHCCRRIRGDGSGDCTA